MSTAESEEYALTWSKASKSVGNGACVEVAKASKYVAIRDSKDPYGGMLQSSPSTWRSFLSGIKQGTFDIPR
jgi:hypothetical protein